MESNLGPASQRTERAEQRGAWSCDTGRGRFYFSSGRLDDHLLLELEHGRLSVDATAASALRRADVSVQPWQEQRGLSFLRLIASDTPQAAAQPRERLEELETLLGPALPGLRLRSTPRAGEIEARGTVEESGGHGQAGGRVAQRSRNHDQTDQPLLTLALRALEHGHFKDAEHLGRQARRAGETEASEFLEALEAVRQASKVVRRHPHDVQARLTLAQAYFLAEGGAAALREAEEVLRLQADLGEAHALIGLEMLVRGDQARARIAAQLAQTLLPPKNRWLRALLAGLRAPKTARRRRAAVRVGRRANLWAAVQHLATPLQVMRQALPRRRRRLESRAGPNSSPP